jgi:hypothetical protein
MSKSRDLGEFPAAALDIDASGNLDVTGTVTADGLTVSDSQAVGVTASISNSNSTQTGGSRLDFQYGATVTGRIQNRFNGGEFQTDWYVGSDGLGVFTDVANTEQRLRVLSNGDISFYEDTGTTPKFFWDASVESLTLSGNGAGSLTLDRGASSNQLKFENAGATLGYFGYLDGTGFSFAGSDGATDVTIDSSGNVGIGTSSPAALSHVSSGYVAPTGGVDANIINLLSNAASGANYVGLGLLSGNNGGSFIHFGDTDQMDIGGIAYFHDNNRMQFTTNGSERMRIDSAGNLLVGCTASPAAFASNGHAFVGASSTAGVAPVAAYNSTGTANCPVFNVLSRDASTDSSNRFMQFFSNVTSSTGTAMGGIVGNGTSNVQFAALSDVREKQNITSLSGSLSKINKLNPVEFDWIKSGEHCEGGFVAQEVEEIFPEYVIQNVSNGDDEERKGITGGMTAGFVSHLVKAIQEQQTLIEALTARITALEAK